MARHRLLLSTSLPIGGARVAFAHLPLPDRLPPELGAFPPPVAAVTLGDLSRCISGLYAFMALGAWPVSAAIVNATRRKTHSLLKNKKARRLAKHCALFYISLL